MDSILMTDCIITKFIYSHNVFGHSDKMLYCLLMRQYWNIETLCLFLDGNANKETLCANITSYTYKKKDYFHFLLGFTMKFETKSI